MASIKDIEHCPNCNHRWEGEDIFEYFNNARLNADHPQHASYSNSDEEEILRIAGNYGWTQENKKTFSILVGIEVQGVYDGVLLWQCPNCEHLWGRFSETYYGKLPNFTEVCKKEILKMNSKPVQ